MNNKEDNPFYNSNVENSSGSESDLQNLPPRHITQHEMDPFREEASVDESLFHSAFGDVHSPPEPPSDGDPREGAEKSLSNQNEKSGKVEQNIDDAPTYSTLFQKQGGSKWLNEINIEPYLHLKKSHDKLKPEFDKSGPSNMLNEAFRKFWKNEKVSKQTEMDDERIAHHRKPSNGVKELPKDEIRETLLPQNFTREVQIEREPKDILFKYLFIISFTLFFIIGLVLVFMYPTTLLDEPTRQGSLYRVFSESFQVFCFVSGISIMATLAWAYLMQTKTEQMIWAIVGLVPVGCIVLTFLSLVSGWKSYQQGNQSLLFSMSFAGFFLLIFLAFTYYIRSKRQQIETTISVARMAGTVLQHNPALFFASTMILIAYIAFLGVWLFFYGHLLLIGHVENNKWVLDSASYYLHAFYLFILVWTTGVLNNIQRSVIGGVVAQWYFMRHDPSYRHSETVKNALRISLKYSFGQISLGALLLTGVQMLRYSFLLIRNLLNALNLNILRAGLGTISFVIGFFERILEHITQFALYYVALKGEGFFTSGRTIARIFRRNLLTSWISTYVTQVVFLTSALVTSLVSGVSVYVFAATVLNSEHLVSMTVLYSAIAWYLMMFYSNIVIDTMDATFMCYAVDVDSDNMHNEEIHRVYSQTASNV